MEIFAGLLIISVMGACVLLLALAAGVILVVQLPRRPTAAERMKQLSADYRKGVARASNAVIREHIDALVKHSRK